MSDKAAQITTSNEGTQIRLPGATVNVASGPTVVVTSPAPSAPSAPSAPPPVKQSALINQQYAKALKNKQAYGVAAQQLSNQITAKHNTKKVFLYDTLNIAYEAAFQWFLAKKAEREQCFYGCTDMCTRNLLIKGLDDVLEPICRERKTAAIFDAWVKHNPQEWTDVHQILLDGHCTPQEIASFPIGEWAKIAHGELQDEKTRDAFYTLVSTVDL